MAFSVFSRMWLKCIKIAPCSACGQIVGFDTCLLHSILVIEFLQLKCCNRSCLFPYHIYFSIMWHAHKPIIACLSSFIFVVVFYDES